MTGLWNQTVVMSKLHNVGCCRFLLGFERAEFQRLNLEYDEPLTNFNFNFDMRRYNEGSGVHTAMHFIVQGVAENPVFMFSADDPDAIQTAVLNVNRGCQKRPDGREQRILRNSSIYTFGMPRCLS
jgi:hypothetical protein